MIKPVKKVHIEEHYLLPGKYFIETKDESVFEFLREFGTIGPGNDRRYFSPSKLYDSDDIKDMLDSLNTTPPNLIQKATNIVKKLKECDGETIEKMRVGQRAYTVPWAYEDLTTLRWNYTVSPQRIGTCNMPITRVSLDTWEVKLGKSSFWNCVEVRRSCIRGA